MSSDSKLSASQSNDQVRKLILGAIKSLKKTGGSSSQAILQYIRSVNSSNIDATEVERDLEIAQAEKTIICRINKKNGFKFYRIKKAILKKADGEKNNKNGKKVKGQSSNVKKNGNSSKKSKKKAKDSNSAEKNETARKGSWFCEICKVSVTSQNNWDSHNRGKKHMIKVKEKGQKKNKKSSNSSEQLAEQMDRNDIHSSSTPGDFLPVISSPPETSLDVSNRKIIHRNDHEVSNRKESHSNDCEVSNRKKSYSSDHVKSDRKKNSYSNDYEIPDRKKSYSNDYEKPDRIKSYSNDYEIPDRKKSHSNNYDVSDRKKSNSNNYDVSDRKRSHSNDYRNNYSKPISPSNNYYSPNHREPYYNNQNYSNRNYHWNTWSPNQAFSSQSKFLPDKGFHSLGDYNRYDQNYHFNESPLRGNRPLPVFNNWADMPNPESNEFFIENIQSENIQPVECNTNYETHSNSKNMDEIIKTSTDDQKSPTRKTLNVADKKAKKSPRIPVKPITKISASTEDILNQSGSEKQQKDVVLSENMTGKRLAHWINPSNQKDQAEIRRLVTEFSKSKKKENLIKLKLHTDKVAVNSDGNQSALEGTNNLNSLPMTPEVPESENSTETSSETIANVSSNSLADNSIQMNKRQRSSSFTDIASNASSPVELLPSSRNRSESLTLDENSKKPQSRHPKRIPSSSHESPSSRKRKDSVELGGTPKRHKCSSAECLEKCIESAISGNALIHPERTESLETAPLTVNTTPKDFSSQKEGVYIKKEVVEELDAAEMTSLSLNELIQKQTDVIASCQDDASLTPVESLINLFATGNVTIKKEFDDPLIDAIRNIDPVLLDKVCENQPDKNGSSQETIEKAIEPVIVPSPVIPNSSLASLSSAPSLTLSLKNILNELQIISEEEEKLKDNLQKADQQIQHYQVLLDKWKTKKIKFQSEEEILRNKRNTLVKTMNDLVVQQNSECRSTTESPGSEERPPSNPLQSTNVISNATPLIGTTDSIKKEIDVIESDHTENHSSTALPQDTTKESPVRVDSEDDVIPVENDEVVVLPSPASRIPVIDLDHIGSPDNDKSNGTDVFSKKKPNTDSISANCHKIRDLVVHNAVINSLQIFDDYLYTCANDKTAKRFSFKDPTKVVTFSHAEKNIFHLCVEKMHGKTYVFTSAFNSNLVTVFDAQSALKVKVHQFRSIVANMCKGKSKIYIGLKVGLIVICDWKDQKELVYNEEPIRSIATAHQGGINILVTLSTKGNVSVRDADRNGLLIKYVKALTHVPLFMSIYNDWVYLSSAGYLSVLDLSTGTFVKKYELPAAYTSLTVYKDHIFTTSFSGFVRCYSKYDIKDVKAYYGAGKMALTCIHAHDDWVFTGNRTGEISVFKFDSETSLPCQFGKCSMVFARLDDLMYHVLQGKDHNLISLKTCLWRKCNAAIKRSWDQDAIHNHIRAHITASIPCLHEPMYNLTV